MLYQYTQTGLAPLSVETSAENVKTADGGNVSQALLELETAVAGKAGVKGFFATLEVAAWSDAAPYEQTVRVEGITAGMEPICDLTVSSHALAVDEMQAWAHVGRVTTGDGSITAYCYEEKPETDISLRLMVVA